MRNKCPRRVFELISAKHLGVFIVLVDHAVLVHANSGAIIDSEEMYTLKLEVLKVGGLGAKEARNLKFHEIRRVIKEIKGCTQGRRTSPGIDIEPKDCLCD